MSQPRDCEVELENELGEIVRAHSLSPSEQPRGLDAQALGKWLLRAAPVAIQCASGGTAHTVTEWGLQALQLALEAAVLYAKNNGKLPPNVAEWVLHDLIPVLSDQGSAATLLALAQNVVGLSRAE